MLQVIDDGPCSTQTLSNAPTDGHSSPLRPPTTEQQLPPHEPLNSSRPPTPDNDQLLFDEPSSALASRIMHAQDNPSPPPSSPMNTFRLIDISEPATPSHPALELPGSTIPLPFSPLFGGASPPHLDQATPQGDLITFDVNDEPAMTFGASCSDPSANDPKMTPSETFRPPSTDCNSEPADGRSTQSLPIEESFFIGPSDSKGGAQELGGQVTPVRRSARTRRSTTSQSTFLIGSLEDSDHSLVRTMSPSGSKTRIRRKSAKLLTMIDSPGKQSLDGAEKQHSGVREVEVNNQHRDAPSAGGNPCHRLSSLSPASSHVLSQLIAASLNEESHSSKSPISTDSVQKSTTLSIEVPRTPLKSSIIASTPQRIKLDQSPSKSFDQFRTPARRILVEEAPSILVGSSKPFSRTAVTGSAINFGLPRTPMFHIPSNDSPARRVLIPETTLDNSGHSNHDVMPPRSPVRRVEIRSYSEEPMASHDPLRTMQGRSNSVEPQLVGQQAKRTETLSKPIGGSASSSSRLRKLPFPLIPEAIPEESGNPSATSLAQTITSTLKQRTSKIPRIGNKPYARPATVAATAINKPPGLVRSVQPPKPTAGVSTFQSKHAARSQIVPDRTSTYEPTKAPPAHTANQITMVLKRKRGSEDIQSPSKTSRVPPRPSHRSIVPQIAKETNRAPAKLSSTPTPDDAQTSRQDVFTNSQQQQTPAAGMTVLSLHLPPCSVVDIHRDKQDTERLPVEPDTVPDITVPAPSAEKLCFLSLDDSTSVSVPATEPQVAEKAESSSVDAHRTTRSRKRMESTTLKDVPRSSQSRKKGNNSRRSDPSDALSTMSAVALKALTNSNTARNQQYVAAKIQTEVIKKSGSRPTSPTVKTRTILQRTQDEQGRKRRERAQRRAQRSEGASGDDHNSAGTSESPTSTALLPNDTDEVGSVDSPSRHRRGAGEDEDYQTPERPLKKVAICAGPELGDVKAERRVKWDKGLFIEVCLDEVHLGARPLYNNPTVTKGCLAPTSKVLSLDTMGNLPNASVPVEDIVEEPIVVKKYVYDDDEELAPPIAQGTRSRAKKSKT